MGIISLLLLLAIVESLSSTIYTTSSLDTINYISHILIAHARTGREAHTHLEELDLHTIGIDIGSNIDRLLVHRFPQRPRLDAGIIEIHAQSLHIVIRLAVRHRRIRNTEHTGSILDHRNPILVGNRHNPLLLPHECFQLCLKLIHVRLERHHIIVVKSLLDILLFHTLLAHVSQAQVNSFSWFSLFRSDNLSP